MRLHRAVAPALAFLSLLVVSACGSSDDSGLDGSGGSTATGGTGGSAGAGGAVGGSGGTGGASGEAGAAGEAGGTGAVGGGAGEAGAGGDAGAAGSGGAPIAADPAQPGPYDVTFVDGDVTVESVGSEFPTRCFFPEAEPGPFPLVTFAHGFQLPTTQYYVSADSLARFGFVVCVPAFEAGMFTPNHAKNAREIVGVIDWALDPASPVAAVIDPQRIGATGHSLGGKLSVLAASYDNRIGAVLGLDPVDSSTNCNPTNCPDATDQLPLNIPTGFLGETLDASGSFQACAPADDNFETFYAAAGNPSFKVHIDGANHMSFLDDPGSCGLACSFCKTPTRDHAEVIALTRSYLAAFFLRHLGGNPSYDEYLTGATAQQRYVQTGVATIESK